jgi:two-component system, LuxR family, response regulator FixJ
LAGDRRSEVLAPNDQQIFLIDADDVVRDSLKVLLESHGLPVHEFRSAEEFLADMGAPGSGCLVLSYNRAIANGLELAATLRRRGVATPVIFIVGGGNATTKAAALAAGAFAYIERPVEETALIRAVTAALARKGGGRAATADPATLAPARA